MGPRLRGDDTACVETACPKNKKPALPPAFVDCYLASRSVRGFELGFLARNRALDGRLHLFESADLDLPHAFAGDAELGGEVFQRHRLFRQAPRLEDAAFARIEHTDGAVQRLTAMIELLALRYDGFLAR